MSIINLPILNLKTEKEFVVFFKKTYLKATLKLEKYSVKIFPEDFKHICYTHGKDGRYKDRFSFRRARRILAIKKVCEGQIPYILIHQVERKNKSICVLCEEIELGIYLIPKISKQGSYFRLGTIIPFGEKISSRIKKQKKQGVKINSAKKAFQNVKEGC